MGRLLLSSQFWVMSSQIKSFLLPWLDSDWTSDRAQSAAWLSAWLAWWCDGPQVLRTKVAGEMGPSSQDMQAQEVNFGHCDKSFVTWNDNFESPGWRDVFYCQFYCWYVVLNLISVHSLAIEHLLFRLSSNFYFSEEKTKLDWEGPGPDSNYQGTFYYKSSLLSVSPAWRFAL